jgi:predicted aspartyl protease
MRVDTAADMCLLPQHVAERIGLLRDPNHEVVSQRTASGERYITVPVRRTP